jgi:hypothetical protein
MSFSLSFSASTQDNNLLAVLRNGAFALEMPPSALWTNTGADFSGDYGHAEAT